MKLFRTVLFCFALGLLLSACVSDADFEQAQATASKLAEANKALSATNGQLVTQLEVEKAKSAKISTELARVERVAQAERDAKWRARNEVAGAQKVAKTATLAAHSVGVKQGTTAKPKS